MCTESSEQSIHVCASEIEDSEQDDDDIHDDAPPLKVPRLGMRCRAGEIA